MTSALEALQQTLNQNLEKFQTVQKGRKHISSLLQKKTTYRFFVFSELQKTQQSRQQLVQQKSENEMVLDVSHTSTIPIHGVLFYRS